jgi:hypothetical protein
MNLLRNVQCSLYKSERAKSTLQTKHKICHIALNLFSPRYEVYLEFTNFELGTARWR